MDSELATVKTSSDVETGSNCPAEKVTGLVFDIRRYSVHDGPGIRTTVFFKGCPLSCWWCHNPEGRSPKPSLLIFAERCRKCGECIQICPNDAIVETEDGVRTTAACRACGTCVEICLSRARELAGRWMTVAEVTNEVEKDLVFYDESGGGVTFSGGEPLSQPLFLEALLDACAERRIHTVVDTCGFADKHLLRRLSKKVGMFLYDFKLLDPAKHKKYVGVPNDGILENLEVVAQSGSTVVIRFPVIPGVNDGPEDVDQMAEFLSSLRLWDIHLLPYHRIGIDKYARLGMGYRLRGLAPPLPDHLQRIAQQFERKGFVVTLGG